MKPVSRTKRPTTSNHEVWVTCLDCEQVYDIRAKGCCPQCGSDNWSL
ncbi:hypothetical protein [Mangrovibacterium sp.]